MYFIVILAFLPYLLNFSDLFVFILQDDSYNPTWDGC